MLSTLFTARKLPVAHAAIGVAIVALAWPVQAQDRPEFRRGLWEFTRSVSNAGPRTFSGRRCTNPSEDMRAQREKGLKAGCKATPVTHSGATYTFHVSCEVKGVAIESTSVMTVESPNAYKVDVQSHAGNTTARETTVARRVGDC